MEEITQRSPTAEEEELAVPTPPEAEEETPLRLSPEARYDTATYEAKADQEYLERSEGKDPDDVVMDDEEYKEALAKYEEAKARQEAAKQAEEKYQAEMAQYEKDMAAFEESEKKRKEGPFVPGKDRSDPLPPQKPRRPGEAASFEEHAAELGGALVGAPMAAVEGLGSTAEMFLTGQALDPAFKPTWLQIPDEYQPPTNTLTGKLATEIGSFFTGYGAIGVLGKINKVRQVAQWVEKGGKAIKVGKYVPGVFKSGGAKKSALATFISSSSEGETVNDITKEWFPYWTLTATNPQSSPLEKKLKHVIEDLGMGGVAEKLFAHRAGEAVAKAIDDGTIKPVTSEEYIKITDDLQNVTKQLDELPEGVTPARLELEQQYADLQRRLQDVVETDPEGMAAKVGGEIKESQQNAMNEQLQLDLFEKGLREPTPATHPQFYSDAERAVRGTRVGNFYNHMKDMLAMASRGDYSAGRRARLVTDAAIKRMTRGGGELKKQLDAFAEELQKGMELPAGANVGGLKTTLDGVRQLAIARYTDIMSGFPDLAKADFDDIRQLLLEDAIEIPNVSGGKTKVMNSANAMALEMMMYDLGAAVSDKATALQYLSTTGVPVKEGVANLLTKVEAAFMMHQEASEFAGSLLRARRGDVFTQRVGDSLTAVNKKKQLKTFTSELGKLMESDPDIADTFMRAFAESNGEVHTLEALKRYAADTVFNWKSVIGTEGAKSKFIEGVFNTLYNSILSAPKTLSRAFSGTGLLTVMRPIQIAMGGALSADQKMMAKGLHMAFDNMQGAIGEAWQLAKSTHYSLINNQAGPYVNQIMSPAESAHWKKLGKIIEQDGNLGEQAMYRLTSTLMDFNNNRFVRYPSNAMASIDSFFKTLVGRQELKARAFEAAWNESNGKVTKDLLRSYEAKLKDSIFNKQGEVIDLAAQRAGQEVALQVPLTGKLGELDSLLNRTPLLRPFFLFMKTGANAISVVSKHTPILARFNDDVRAILSATSTQMDGVAKFGITTPAQLAQQKALIRGRIATGYMTVGAATGLYMTGRLTGNGPADRELRNSWIRSGKWRPRSIKLGNKWVNYDGLEPFASFLALVADIGDNATSLGEAGTEEMFRKAGYLISMNLTNKSFLAGLQPLTDILAFDGARGEVWAANLTNNFIPWSGARNEIANVLNPGLREVERDFATTIANRNPFFRGQLPLQYDPLNGDLIKNWDFPTRMWNSISPIQLSGADNPTRKALRESGFDLATTFNTDSFGNRLKPAQRSKMMELMGKYNIEGQLEKLFADPQIKKEMEHYRKLRNQGVKGKDLDDPANLRIENALFFREIGRIFRDTKKMAETELFQIYPELMEAGYDTRVKKNMQQAGMIEQVEQLFYSTQNK